MAELEPIFEQLGLQQYLSAFLEEGFDTWEVVSCITESDLWDMSATLLRQLADIWDRDTLNVKLGHRRVRLSFPSPSQFICLAHKASIACIIY